jgi:glycosyltransferase involved in cell wall biosynthesis/tetratricopeptide (TPR) repeat protein
MLFTDAGSGDVIPESIRSVVDESQYGNLSSVNKGEIPATFDGAVIWCKGEAPMRGSPAEWRRTFFSPLSRNTTVAVHWPYLEHADLLGLEPRLLRAQSTGTIWNPSLRIAGSSPTEKRKTAWRASGKPWARLSLSIWQELERPGSGLDSLLELWNSSAGDAQLSSLVLRNLIVVLMKTNQWEKAGELLDLGNKAFPDCAEFPYLHAVYFILQKSPSKAVRFLEAALSLQGREFVGSGGENSYRAKYLLGVICNIVGQQEKAIHYWAHCAMEQPAFEPAVRELLQQRLPHGKARWLHHPLAEMARREPQYLKPVVDFFIANNMALAGRRLVETIDIDSARREDLLRIVNRAEDRFTARSAKPDVKPGILLTGPIFDASGHSRINRAIGQALLESLQFETSLDHTTWPTLPPQTLKHAERLWKASGHQLERVDITIRHQWPPDFDRAASGKTVCILPWEHKAVPVRWIDEIGSNVDEVWTPSQFTRSAFVDAGLPPERVRVIYNAVDPEVFRPDGPVHRPPNSKGFVFLFVGGTIRRKGIDLLLQAYADAFMPEEDVTLVIKDLGSRTFYSHNTKIRDVQQFAARRSTPHTIVLTEEMEDSALAALYRGADAFVLPYRGEGFGMPLIEAMACGKPIITTGEGPAVEFCSEQEGYLIPAREVEVPEPPPPVGPLSGDWTWFEPNIAALAQTMRHVYEHRDESAGRGRNAAVAIERGFTWKTIQPIYIERIRRLLPESASIHQLT